MKVAVSIPDDLKQAADRRAEELGTSRSAVFAEALRLYLLHTEPDRITAALDAVHGSLQDDARDGFVAAAATDTLTQSEW